MISTLTLPLLLAAGVLTVLFSNADTRFDRFAAGVCLTMVCGALLATALPGVPLVVVRTTTVVGFLVTVVVFVTVLVNRYLHRNGTTTH